MLVNIAKARENEKNRASAQGAAATGAAAQGSGTSATGTAHTGDSQAAAKAQQSATGK